jgi:hypothetical protein
VFAAQGVGVGEQIIINFDLHSPIILIGKCDICIVLFSTEYNFLFFMIRVSEEATKSDSESEFDADTTSAGTNRSMNGSQDKI